MAWRARYRTWGNTALEEWDHQYARYENTVEDRSQNIRLQGQFLDTETGLHYNTFKYYDPDIGRFATQDPIGLLGGLNLYQYAPDPSLWIDPWGWWCFTGGSARAAKKGFPGIGTTKNGGPTFKGSKYLYKTKPGEKNIVNFKLTESRPADFDKANQLAGLKKTPDTYVWHHVDNFNPKSGRATLELIKTPAHQATLPHKGSVGQYEDYHGVDYKK